MNLIYQNILLVILIVIALLALATSHIRYNYNHHSNLVNTILNVNKMNEKKKSYSKDCDVNTRKIVASRKSNLNLTGGYAKREDDEFYISDNQLKVLL